MKHIVCFGDSNTFGHRPDGAGRFEDDIRWTGVAQNALGSGYRIIEEGLNNRTTVYYDPWDLGRVGRDNLISVLLSHRPMDLLIIHLGTNDLKFTDARNAAIGAGTLVRMAKEIDMANGGNVFVNGPKILLVSPIRLKRCASDDRFSSFFGKYETSLEFPEQFAHAAQSNGAEILHASMYAEPSDLDGIHLDAGGHAALGHAIAKKIKEILG